MSIDIEKAYVITLARRSDRMAAFKAHTPPSEWPTIEPWLAVDGKKVPPPKWWRPSAGAWGCMQSHASILQHCLNTDVKTVLVLEDDAFFANGIAAMYREFVAAVPDDWELLYLGGEYINTRAHPPTVLGSGVKRGGDVNRTHAMLYNRKGMEKVYKHIMQRDWHPRHQVDHHIGMLTRSGGVRTYCPETWMVGQDEGASDIQSSGRRLRQFKRRMFNKPVGVPTGVPTGYHHPLLLIAGIHRTGSSCVAKMCAKLGVHMGDCFAGCEEDGGHECAELTAMCEKWWPFPQAVPITTGQAVFEEASAYLRRRYDAQPKMWHGVKYPHLSRYVRAFVPAAPYGVKIVVCRRPLEESIASLQARQRRDDPAVIEAHQRSMHAMLEESVAVMRPRCPVLELEYHDTLKQPLATARQLAEFMSPMPVTEDQITEAALVVDRKKAKHVTASITA